MSGGPITSRHSAQLTMLDDARRDAAEARRASREPQRETLLAPVARGLNPNHNETLLEPVRLVSAVGFARA